MAKRAPPVTQTFTIQLPTKWFAAEFAIVIERAAREQIEQLTAELEWALAEPADKRDAARIKRRLAAWKAIQARAMQDAHY
jgi:hypothetical protein